MKEAPVAKRKRLNADQKRAVKAASLHSFVEEYGRKKRKGWLDPNDRRYDRGIQKAVRRMKRDELDRLLRDDEG